MNEYEVETVELLTKIGERIRQLRKSRGLKLQDLAQKTGFTKSYLSQIENSKREPPISTLAKIAYVLEADVTYLISGEMRPPETTSLTFVRKGEGRAHYGPFGEKGFHYESVAHNKPDRLMDAYLITVGPEFPPKAFSHQGQEFVYVIEGVQEFFYDGKTYYFNPGDSFFFNSDKPHYSRTVGQRTGKVLMVFAMRKADQRGDLLPLNRID